LAEKVIASQVLKWSAKANLWAKVSKRKWTISDWHNYECRKKSNAFAQILGLYKSIINREVFSEIQAWAEI